MTQWKARLLVVALFVVLDLFGLDHVRAQASDNITVIRGVVKKQIHGCEVDGVCSVLIKTDEGDVGIIWNQGDVMPGKGCIIRDEVARTASALKKGQKVEIHLPQSSKNVLCGDQAAVIVHEH